MGKFRKKGQLFGRNKTISLTNLHIVGVGRIELLVQIQVPQVWTGRVEARYMP